MIQYIETALQGFVNDPPDTDFQRGYLAALIAVAREIKATIPPVLDSKRQVPFRSTP